jgi:hypothetical protein
MDEPRRPKLLDELPAAQRDQCNDLMRQWREMQPTWDAVTYQYRIDDSVTLRANREVNGELVSYTEETVLPDGSLLQPAE